MFRNINNSKQYKQVENFITRFNNFYFLCLYILIREIEKIKK